MSDQDEIERYDVLTGRMISGSDSTELVVERKRGESQERERAFLDDIMKDPCKSALKISPELDKISSTLYFVFVPSTSKRIFVAPFYPMAYGAVDDFCQVIQLIPKSQEGLPRVVLKQPLTEIFSGLNKTPQLLFECQSNWINEYLESDQHAPWAAFCTALKNLPSGAEIGHCGISPETFHGSKGEIRGTGLALLMAAMRIRWPKVRQKIGNVIGDPRYAAPEVLDGQVPDYRSDLFSAAVTFCKRRGGECRPVGDRNTWGWVADDFFGKAKFKFIEEVGLRTLLDPDPAKRVAPTPLAQGESAGHYSQNRPGWKE